MKISDINPYVRFARKQIKKLQHQPVVALDHRIFYCLSGEGSIQIGSNVYKLKSGSLIFWRAGIPYKTITEDSSLILYGINFDFFSSESYPKMPVSYVKEKNYNKDMIIEKNLPAVFHFLPDCLHLPFAPVGEKFEEIIREYTEKELYFEERCSTLLKDIIILSARHYYSKEKHPQNSKTDRILSYIREHYNESLTNSSIAKYFSYHPNYISNLIKKRTGMTLHQYLLQYRIHMAILFLQSAEYNVTETASLTGFVDVKHFSKSFIQITGNTPSSYLLKY